jgi:multidrug efflux pump subunit AcrA (membrane-fusion protein)
VNKVHLAIVVASLALSGCASSTKSAAEKPDVKPAEISIDDTVRKDLGITTVQAEEAPVGAPVSATGQLQVNEDATWVVGAITDGKITSVPVLVGDQVREGQPLAILHSHEVHDARATLRQAMSELARQKVLAEQARSVRDRARRLLDLRAASREQVDAAETMYVSATNSVATAQADVDKARFHLTDFLEVPEESPSAGHDPKLEGLTIKAPASGTLMERKATAGTVVSTGDPVFTIANLGSLWLIAAVNEADMSRVRPNQRVQITVRAFTDRKFTGRVLRLGERLDPQTRNLQVRVLIPNPGGLLKPEMFATAEFETGETRRSIQVPEGAVQQINGKPIVFLKTGTGAFHPAEVTLGSKNAGRVELLSGVNAGELVVVGGAYLLKTQLMKDAGN